MELQWMIKSPILDVVSAFRIHLSNTCPFCVLFHMGLDLGLDETVTFRKIIYENSDFFS